MARVDTPRARRIVTFANSKRDVARTLWRGRFQAIWRKSPATLLGRLLRRPNLKRPASGAKKVEMLFAHLRRILRLGACGYGGRVAQRTSSCSPRPRKTYDGSRVCDPRRLKWRHKPHTKAASPPPRRRGAAQLPEKRRHRGRRLFQRNRSIEDFLEQFRSLKPDVAVPVLGPAKKRIGTWRPSW
jgi:hypothetical protein